ncbi:DNA-3-methyladenine glycosylase [Dethiosulfatibacter aminovorans DSM 17477]|uniref:Putative 3-methyladenine DNA glycosylase n=2 Tax=Dethiosulfatibacter TaxID=448125 RepID=A0A1M6J0B4_9FIRM|nr:DNA-3-methyladenine glycosylase [Dethiosulfatibacter aminovorans DSM 17477]
MTNQSEQMILPKEEEMDTILSNLAAERASELDAEYVTHEEFWKDMGLVNKLDREFYNRPTLDVARDLVGKVLVHKGLSLRITETEAYIGDIDKACHCYKGRITERTRVMFGPPGFSYIYLIYGMYNCFNIVTERKGCGCAVLIRGGIPLDGRDEMSMYRFKKPYVELSGYQKRNFANGPGKLCMALNLTRDQNSIDLLGDELYLYDDGYTEFDIEIGKRINIDYAEEAKDFMWRFRMNPA